jgi:serine/threonine protein kinase
MANGILDVGQRGHRTPRMKIVDVQVQPSPPGFEPRTWVLAVDGSQLYIAKKRGAIDPSSLDQYDPSSWTDTVKYMPPQRLRPANLYPVAEPSYHRFRWRKGESDANLFKKHPNLLQLASDWMGTEMFHGDHVALLTQREICTCESLRNNPHPNIAKYRGVQCAEKLKYTCGGAPVGIALDTERVLGIVFKRYAGTLTDLVNERKTFDVGYCLRSISNSIKHMHSLGIAHCDVKPDNIFVDVNTDRNAAHAYEFVLGDFDSAALIGSLVELKGGDIRWSRHKRLGRDIVEKGDDWFAFENVKTWLKTRI